MRLPVTLALLAAGASAALAQQPPVPAEAPPAKRTLREVWNMTESEYRLVDSSRRRNGATYAYFAARGRGPHGNMREPVPGGPQAGRPVSKPRETAPAS